MEWTPAARQKRLAKWQNDLIVLQKLHGTMEQLNISAKQAGEALHILHWLKDKARETEKKIEKETLFLSRSDDAKATPTEATNGSALPASA